MSHNSLENYYLTIFYMVRENNFSIEEIENLIVFERDVYVDLLEKFLKERGIEIT